MGLTNGGTHIKPGGWSAGYKEQHSGKAKKGFTVGYIKIVYGEITIKLIEA